MSRLTATGSDGPTLNPATRLLWRPDGLLQLELGARAVVVEAPVAATVRRLAGVAGSGAGGRTPTRPAEPAAARPASRPVAATLDALTDAGFLWPPAPAEESESRLAAPQPQLAAELRSLSARHGVAAAELLDARRQLSVVVSGENRAGPTVAALLAAAGVGRVHVRDIRPVRMHQALPGGIAPEDEGRPFAAAAAEAVRRAAPDTDTRPPAPDEHPDLVVLACDEPVDPDYRAALHARRQAHLPVRLAPDHGVVGPLVVPGLTSCLHCADLHRLDRDPAWSALAVQLCIPPATGVASPITLATVLAGVAAAQALAYLDGEQPAVIDGTLEQHLPDWRIRRRSWPVHPDCDCTGPDAG
jgi:hypothetical protein